ncbi:MAG: hypothetical protein OEY52_07295 [Gammaproteobacteria bacterium]|nr:hypothetical protein [Gammaproteobacteria bacterium]
MTSGKNKLQVDGLSAESEQFKLAELAATGDKGAREKVNSLAHPVISYQTGRFCKRFCNDNRYRYVCTLTNTVKRPVHDEVLCEWGNASYAWMLDDLTNAGRLRQYSGKNGARLYDYFYFIANSLPFYERWKDWRFGRKVHVPTYIRALFPEAAKVFYGLRAGDNIAAIAQKLCRSEKDTEMMCHQIIITLTQRKRLYLLDPPNTVSLSSTLDNEHEQGDSPAVELDIPYFDELPEKMESREKLAAAWQQLSPVEQYVVEAMVLDNLDASDVLGALERLNISIKSGIEPNKVNRQQLYYFCRKTLARLAGLMK